MTNPDSTVGTNAGYNGRTTPNAFNDILAAYTRGLVSGWTCSPKSGMTVQLGGDGSTRDVAIAEDNAGNKTTINNRTATPVEITLDGAPSTGNRIDSIVAYVENPQNGAGATDVDFPSQVGIIAVKGTAAGTPTAPNEATIRTAITADGGNGASAYYVVLANITVGQSVTTIGSGAIAAGTSATSATPISDGAITTAKLAKNAITNAKIDWSTILGTINDSTDTNDGYIDFGSIRVQWMTRKQTGLNTGAGTFNQWTTNLPASFGNNYYTVVLSQMSDTGNIAGDELKLVGHTTTSLTIGYNHTNTIGSTQVYYGVIAIGRKP